VSVRRRDQNQLYEASEGWVRTNKVSIEIHKKKKGMVFMNKGDLINEVAEVMSSKKDAQKAVDSVLSAITGAMKKGEAVTLVGFGTFKVTERKARMGRNPQTGEEMKIEAKSVPKFIPGKALKEAVK
jgi:DNA-binding protein HU-beta